MALIINSNYNRQIPSKYTTVEGASLTIPDEALSLREIVARYNDGVNIDYLQRFAVYDPDDVDFNDLVMSSGLRDLSEIDQLIAEEEAIADKIQRAKALKAEIDKKEPIPVAEPEKEPEEPPQPPQ